MLKLYHYGDSLCSIKARYMLEEKGVAYESCFVDLMKFDNLQPDYLKLNPNGVVPTIEHDGKIVIESSIIIEYVNDAFEGPDFKPADLWEQSRMRFFMKMQDDIVHPAVQKPTFNLLVKPLLKKMDKDEFEAWTARHPHEANRQMFRKAADGPVDNAAIDGAIEKFRLVFGRMNDALDLSTWVSGETFSLADIALAPAIDRLEACGLSDLFDEFSNVARWCKRIRRRSAFGRAIPIEAQRFRNYAAAQ
jgi:glutathione S-transferase